MVTKAAFYWNGHPAEGGGNFTLQAGSTPSTAVLRFPLSTPIAQTGTLVLANISQSLSFSRCRVVRTTIPESGGSGRYREVTIEDRRWMWADRYLPVFGEFNRQNPPRGSQRNPLSVSGLAVRLFSALGEAEYYISGLPDDQFPSVVWDAASPGVELESLCNQYGCIVGLGPNDRAFIVADGTGAGFNSQDSRLMDREYTFQPKIVPEKLVLDGGALHVHHDLPLRAVAPKDKFSDEFLPIDSVSWKPANGWSATGGNMNAVDINYRQLAIENVFRVYEVCQGFTKAPNQNDAVSIKLSIPPTIKFSSGGNLQQNAQLTQLFTIDNTSIHRLLPLNEARYDFGQGTNDGELRVYGFWWNDTKLNRNARFDKAVTVNSYQAAQDQLPAMANSSAMPLADPIPADSELLVPDGHRSKIDLAHGRVFFNRQVLLKDNDNKVGEAWLRLRCSFPVRDPETMAALTAQYWTTTSNPTPVNIAKVIKNSEIFLEYSLTKNNVAEFIAQASAALAVETAALTNAEGISAPYKTWVFNIPLDGIVKAIAWDQAESGHATTHIDYNIERPSYYETLNERRLRRLFTYNALLDIEVKRRERRRGVTQVRFGAKNP